MKKNLLLLVVLLGMATAISAQSFVERSVALERLEFKLHDIYTDARQSATPVALKQKQIARAFYIDMVGAIENGDAIGDAINLGFTAAMGAYPADETAIVALKNELETLLSD